MRIVALALFALLLAGCADPPSRDWANFHTSTDDAAPAFGEQVRAPVAAPSVNIVDARPNPSLAADVGRAPAGVAGVGMPPGYPSAQMPGAPANSPSVDVGDAPRFDPGEQRQLSPRTEMRLRKLQGQEFPPPAPPAEEPDALASAPANPDVAPHWTGAIIYSQPGCVPCAMLIRDLKAAGWKVGVGNGAHFKVVELLNEQAFAVRNVGYTPCVAYFIDGVEQLPRLPDDPKAGYGGTQAELAKFTNRHPKAKRVGTARFESSAAPSPLWYDSPDCSRPTLAYAPNCAMPKASDCGAPMSYGDYVNAARSGQLNMLGNPVYESAPVVTSVVYSEPVYSIPMYPAWQTQFRAGPAQYSGGLRLFGCEVIGGSVGASF